MSIFGNLSDLAHEIRSGVGTVLTILGSKLEADARARVECGPQWLTEFEEQRDSLEPSEVCAFHGEWCAGEASWCHHLEDSAAVSAAADPSPADSFTVPRAVSDEGSGGDSDILPSPPPERPQCGAQYWCRDLYVCIRPLGHYGDHGYSGSWAKSADEGPRSDCSTCVRCGSSLGEAALVADQGGYWCSVTCQQLDQDSSPVPAVVAGESPREEDEQPSLGAAVTHEDLAAHLIGAAIRANTGHVDVLVEAFASSLLADFNITVREAAGK